MKPSQTMNGSILRLFQDEVDYHRWSASGIVNDGLATEVSRACDKFFEKRGMIAEFKKAYNFYAKKKG